MTETAVTDRSTAATCRQQVRTGLRRPSRRGSWRGPTPPATGWSWRSIAKDLGFSVVPVREAIRRLEAEGLVKFERNVGATVAGIDPTEYLYTMQTLSIVEGAATALSAPLIDAAAIARARAVNEEMRECLDHFDPVRFTRLNQDFHSVLFEHCPNPHILDLVHRGWNRLASLRSSTFRFVPGRAHDSVDEHEALLRLIETGADADDDRKGRPPAPLRHPGRLPRPSSPD